jgi:hypothetical protein
VTPETIDVIGRTKKPFLRKLNVIWWFMNDEEQKVSDPSAAWYHPEWPEWRRWLYWNVFRNPLQNLSAFVLGVQDKNYTVYGKAHALTVQRNDLDPPEYGVQWAILRGVDLTIPRAFISYSGTRLVWYAGWQPSGFFRLKFNITKRGRLIEPRSQETWEARR